MRSTRTYDAGVRISHGPAGRMPADEMCPRCRTLHSSERRSNRTGSTTEHKSPKLASPDEGAHATDRAFRGGGSGGARVRRSGGRSTRNRRRAISNNRPARESGSTMPATTSRPPASEVPALMPGDCSTWLTRDVLSSAAASSSTLASAVARSTSPWTCGKSGCRINPKWSSGPAGPDGGAVSASPATSSNAAIRYRGPTRRDVAILLH